MEAQLGRGMTREALVLDALAGDRLAFAAIYDRYADRIHDFCWSLLRDRDEAAGALADTFVVAARRLGSLRHPSVLLPWLYAIARRNALRRLRAQRGLRRAGSLPQVPEIVPAQGDTVEMRSLRELVWNVVGTLPFRERALLDLYLRQGLDGAELAEAMGMRIDQASTMLARLCTELQQSIGALLVARLGASDCDGLYALLAGDRWATPSMRTRIARHVGTCEGCSARRRGMLSPWALLSAVSMVPASSVVRQQVMQRMTLPPRRCPAATRKPATMPRTLAASMLMVLGIAGFWVGRQLVPAPDPVISGTLSLPPATVESPEPDRVLPQPSELSVQVTPTPPRDAAAAQTFSPATRSAASPAPPSKPAALSLSSTELDLGAQHDRGTVTLGNGGDEPLEWVATTSASWLTLRPAGGTLEGATLAELEVLAERAELPEGWAETTVEVSSSAGAAALHVRLVVERPPQIVKKAVAPAPVFAGDCEPATATVTAEVVDESGVASVVLHWTGPGGQSGREVMSAGGDAWSVVLGPFAEPGSVTWTVVAEDIRGNLAETGSTSLRVERCPAGEVPPPDGEGSPAPSPSTPADRDTPTPHGSNLPSAKPRSG